MDSGLVVKAVDKRRTSPWIIVCTIHQLYHSIVEYRWYTTIVAKKNMVFNCYSWLYTNYTNYTNYSNWTIPTTPIFTVLRYQFTKIFMTDWGPALWPQAMQRRDPRGRRAGEYEILKRVDQLLQMWSRHIFRQFSKVFFWWFWDEETIDSDVVWRWIQSVKSRRIWVAFWVDFSGQFWAGWVWCRHSIPERWFSMRSTQGREEKRALYMLISRSGGLYHSFLNNYLYYTWFDCNYSKSILEVRLKCQSMHQDTKHELRSKFWWTTCARKAHLCLDSVPNTVQSWSLQKRYL